MSAESGIYKGARQLADLTSQTLIDQIKTSADIIARTPQIDPTSPTQFFYEWLGSQAQYDAIITPDPETRYTIV